MYENYNSEKISMLIFNNSSNVLMWETKKEIKEKEKHQHTTLLNGVNGMKKDKQNVQLI